MSTKTTFKRIALVAVAALGLGVLSVAPSSADVSNVTVSVANGTSSKTGGAASDSSTAAVITVSALFDAVGVSGVRARIQLQLHSYRRVFQQLLVQLLACIFLKQQPLQRAQQLLIRVPH